MDTKGFTLIEMLISAILLAALAAIALPSFSASQTRMVTRHAADEFRSARSIAIRNGRVTELHIDAANGRFWVQLDTTAARTGVMDTIGVVRHMANQNVSMTSTRSYVCFDGRGLATKANNCPAGDATVVFSRGARADTVNTTALGKVLR